MRILWIKRMSFGVVIVKLVMVCGYLFLIVLALFAQTSFRNRAEANTDLPSFDFTLLTPSPEEPKASALAYDHLIKAACRKHSMDPALVMAIIHAESQFDPKAVSPKGAVGLMQITPITVKELGINDPFNPQLNIDGGVRYLKRLLDTFDGDKKLALAAYNAGPTQVYRHNGVPPFKETQDFLKRVFRHQTFYRKNSIS
jgi:soluble lytic murein transglycosylase-like protein